MVFGHNSNLKHGAVTFHIQTEDRGEPHSLIDTTVYYQGRVLHRRTNNYFDLLPIDEDREQALKMRVEEQHRAVIEEIRSGYLQLAIPAATSAMHSAETRLPQPQQPAPAIVEPKTLSLELTNAKSWLIRQAREGLGSQHKRVATVDAPHQPWNGQTKVLRFPSPSTSFTPRWRQAL